MHNFEYASPTTKEDAVKLLAASWGETEALAGGTDLLALLKDYVVTPRRVVNLKDIKELKGVTYAAAKGLRLGALVSFEEMLDNAALKSAYPALWQAVAGVTSPQIRNMGTVGGDLCQRPRCWYYRAGYGLLPADNGKPLVADGDNRYHAIIGNSGEAKFVNPSSLAPALIALKAKIKIFGPAGAREVDAEKFFVTPASSNQREYGLASNEIVTDILVPAAAGVKSATYEVRQKEALDWPLAAAAVALTMDGKTVKSARIALGHVAPVPVLAEAAAAALIGKTISEDAAAAAGKAAVASATPLSRNAYKVQLASVAVKRAILQAAG
jgi:xanthine dehydrogenase YagS FAD-binding subunit